MRLAHDLHMTRARLLSEVDSREITDQLAYYVLLKLRRKEEEEKKEKKPEVNLQEKFKCLVGSKIIKNKSFKKGKKK
jgi:hypothetical protein